MAETSCASSCRKCVANRMSSAGPIPPPNICFICIASKKPFPKLSSFTSSAMAATLPSRLTNSDTFIAFHGIAHPQEWSGLYWEWMVNKGRRDGRDLGHDYTEVHFEDVISKPHETLARLGQFIGQELDYDRIREVGIGSVSAPNSSFADGSKREFNPLGRWKEGFPPQELQMFEGLVGRTLEQNGYEPVTKDREVLSRPDLQCMRAIYLKYFDLKLYLKARTPLGRLLVTRDLSWI